MFVLEFDAVVRQLMCSKFDIFTLFLFCVFVCFLILKSFASYYLLRQLS